MLASNSLQRPSASPDLLGCRVPPLRLRLHGGPLDGQDVRLESAKVSIGGAAGCTLRLRSAGSLPLYAWILRGPEGCLVRRFVPQVLLNGGAFEESPLHNGDRLRIGALELEIVSGARGANRGAQINSSDDQPEPSVTLRTDGGACETGADEAVTTDPWARPFQRAFATRSSQVSQQRRSLRRHHARRTRKLLESIRRQEAELNRLQCDLNQKTAEAARLAAAHQIASEDDRVQLEEEARELSQLVEQMSAELREAAAQRAGLHRELGDQGTLRDELAQRELELARSREEADEIRRSTAAQIEQLKHAFELVRQERDDLADRDERDAGLARQAGMQVESLQLELQQSAQLRSQLQAELDQLHQQLAAAEDQLTQARQLGQEQPQLQQQLKFLQTEIERRDRELAEAREAASSQSGQLLASLDHLREEVAELQALRQQERHQYTIENERLTEELAARQAQLAESEAELQSSRASGESEAATLRVDLERLQAELEHLRQQASRERSESPSLRQQLEAELASIQQQLDRRTADWRSAQHTAAAEATQFGKTIEQLRSELQSERTLRQQEAEARQADRRRAEKELAAVRQEVGERTSAIAELQRKLAAETSRLTLQQDQAEREAADLRAKLDNQQAQTSEQQERLQQTIRELTSARAALQAELEENTRESADLRAKLETAQTLWSEQREQLQRTIQELTVAGEAAQASLEQNASEVSSLRAQLETEQTRSNEQQAQLQQTIDELTTAGAASQAELERTAREVGEVRAQLESEQARWSEQLEQLQQHIDELTTAGAASQSGLEQHAREMSELRAKLESEQARWSEEQEQLQQTIRDLQGERAAAQTQLEQVVQEAVELQERAAEEQARWTDEREQLLEQARSLEANQRQHLEEFTTAQQSAAADQQVLHNELVAAADQLRELGEQNEHLREQVTQLQATLEASQAQLEQLHSQPVVTGDVSPEPGAAGEQALAEAAAAQEQLASLRQEFEVEKQQWQQQRETWETHLRQREDDLAAHVAELERQVGEWHARQSQEQHIDDAVAALQGGVAPDALYGSYTPAHEELPPDVTMPLPTGRGVVEYDSPSEGSYAQTMPLEFGHRFGPAEAEVDEMSGVPAADVTAEGHWSRSAVAPSEFSHEETAPIVNEVANEVSNAATNEVADDDATPAAPASALEEGTAEDPDSVTAVLGRLMQAGLWNADAAELSQPLERTLVLDNQAENRVDEASAGEPVFDSPVDSPDLPSHEARCGISPADEDIGCTMDASSLMGQRSDAPRSWRAQLLGDEPEQKLADERLEDSLGAQPASEFQGPSEMSATSDESEEAANAPQQAVGHGSWRAQMLGAEAAPERVHEDSPQDGTSESGEEQPGESSEQLSAAFAPVALPAAQPAEPAGEEEDSIEAYMSKLLKRVRGDNAEPTWSPAPVAPAPVTEAKPAKTPTPKPQPVVPVDPAEFVPQRQAPEASVSLAAMREIANAASRVAIDTHAKRSHTQRFARRLLKAALALFTTAGFAAWGFYGGGTGAWCGVAAGVFMMAWWTGVGIWHMTKAMRLKPAAALAQIAETGETPEEVEAAAPEHSA